MLSQESDPVKLLVHFPQEANLNQITQTLLDTYCFIQCVKKCGKHQLLISFDSMSDLLEIDFIQQFGALSTKVKNSTSFCKQMNESYHNSTTQDAGSSNKIINCSDHPNIQVPQKTQKAQESAKKRERLTSLEDEVNEYQEQMKKLAFFDDSIYFSRLQQAIKQESIQSQPHLQSQQKEQKQNIWGTVLHGVAITSILVGGLKAIKMLFQ